MSTTNFSSREINEMSTGVDTLLKGLQSTLNNYAWKLAAKAKILDQQDIFQELMIAAWRSATRYEEEDRSVTLEQWINTDIFYAGQRLIDRAIRKHKRELAANVSVSILTVDSYDQMTMVEQSLDLQRAAMEVGEKSFRAYHLKVQGFSAEEIAEKLHVSRRQVFNLIHRITDKVDA